LAFGVHIRIALAGVREKDGLQGEQEKQMSYETMEALLVQKIARLRESEATFERSLQQNAKGVSVVALTSAHARMNAQLREVEQLLAAMDAAPAYPSESLPSVIPVDAAPQMNSSVWM
jgi:hypothetical protein